MCSPEYVCMYVCSGSRSWFFFLQIRVFLLYEGGGEKFAEVGCGEDGDDYAEYYYYYYHIS